MLEVPRLLGTPRAERSIEVQTRKGRSLQNYISAEPSNQCRNRFDVICKSIGKHWKIRKGVTGGYNCAGMVWANRRTCLFNPDDWKIILVDDEYRELAAGEPADLGDVVVYFRNPNRAEILHVARVCELRSIAVGGVTAGTPAPYALSKLDPTLGECIHAVRDIRFNGEEDFESAIFTDRPVAGN